MFGRDRLPLFGMLGAEISPPPPCCGSDIRTAPGVMDGIALELCSERPAASVSNRTPTARPVPTHPPAIPFAQRFPTQLPAEGTGASRQRILLRDSTNRDFAIDCARNTTVLKVGVSAGCWPCWTQLLLCVLYASSP